jgi:hypothetical protein
VCGKCGIVIRDGPASFQQNDRFRSGFNHRSEFIQSHDMRWWFDQVAGWSRDIQVCGLRFLFFRQMPPLGSDFLPDPEPGCK